MSRIIIKENYKSTLNLYDTQNAIGFIKSQFELELQNNLNLKRVSAPLFVAAESGLNDDLSGVEKPVDFLVPALSSRAEIVQSLAKWKRKALYDYDFHVYNGLYTDMNAVRKDEILDNTHSIYVDQWDWERVIAKTDRNLEYLKSVVVDIVDSIYEVYLKIKNKYPQIDTKINKEVYFVSSQKLEDMYPDLSNVEREYEIVKKYKTVFIYQIGDTLNSGIIFDQRAPDYDDWSLNGDLLYWHDNLGIALELSSMGIRVDEESLLYQLKKADKEYRLKYEYHQMIISKQLPYTIGGGIGQSRMCMLLLNKLHIGEVQVSLWDDETIETLKGKIHLL